MATNGLAEDRPAEEGRLAYKWRVLISVIFGVFLIILDTTVVNVAFQTLRREFGADINDSQWILSIYVLALGISTPVSGFMADRFGIKRIYIAGLATFLVGSLLCGVAPNLPALIVARAIQGLGGGLAQPLGSALLLSAFPPEEQGKAYGFFGIALVLAPALGPILGGWLVELGLWRWIFFINVPIGILGITLATRWLRERRSERHALLDPVGLATAVVGFGAVLYAASIAAEQGWTSRGVVTWFAVGGIALAIHAVAELFWAKEPLMDLRLFKRRTFLFSNLVGYVTVIGLFGAEFLLPVYLQALRGRTALETGFIVLPLALTAGVMTPLAGRLYDKIGPRILMIAGFSILLINTWQLAQIQATTPVSWLLFLLALRGIALGLTVQTTFTTALAGVPREKLPRATSLVSSTRFVVQSVGVAILATILVSTVSPEVRALQQQFQGAAEEAQTTRFGLCETPGVSAEEAGLPPGLPSNLPAAQTAQVRQGIERACVENVEGFERAYQFTFYMALAALLLGAMLPGWPFHWAGRAAAAAAASH